MRWRRWMVQMTSVFEETRTTELLPGRGPQRDSAVSWIHILFARWPRSRCSSVFARLFPMSRLVTPCRQRKESFFTASVSCPSHCDTRLRLLHRIVFFPPWKLFTSCQWVFQGQSRHWVGCSGLSLTHYSQYCCIKGWQM